MFSALLDWLLLKGLILVARLAVSSLECPSKHGAVPGAFPVGRRVKPHRSSTQQLGPPLSVVVRAKYRFTALEGCLDSEALLGVDRRLARGGNSDLHNGVASFPACADVPVCLGDVGEVEGAVDDGAELACLCQPRDVGEIGGDERDVAGGDVRAGPA